MATKRVPVEVDVTYVNKTWFTLPVKPKENHYVIGFFQREGKAIIKAIPDNKPETIAKAVSENVQKGCMLYAQEGILPESLNSEYEVYSFSPQAGNKVNGDIHVNNVNNMWRDLKRNIKREHVHVSKKHLQLYCDEVAWRINNRHLTPSQKFESLISNCAVGAEKRTYKNLIK